MLHPESVLCVGCKVGSLRAYTPRVAGLLHADYHVAPLLPSQRPQKGNLDAEVS